MSLESLTNSIEESVNSVVDPVAEFLTKWVFYSVPVGDAELPLIVAWLVVAGLLFTGLFGFLQIRKFKLALKVVRGKYDEKGAVGEVNHFGALTAAVSATVGLGNIAGVAVAITIGGAGAAFWMAVCGLLGMATKFVEVTLGVKYRKVHADGTVSGGPMQYLPAGLADRFGAGSLGHKLGKVLGVCAAVFVLFFGLFGGNLLQVNQAYSQLANTTGGDNGFIDSSAGAMVFGIVVALLIGVVLIGGMKSIASVTSKLVPAMAIIYILGCLAVLAVNAGALPGAVTDIFSYAFNPESFAGGLIGALIAGFQRAAFSNEAGLGTAPIAHSAVKTKHPASEGLVALLEPFIDTVVICTMTALTVVVVSPPSLEAARTDPNAPGGVVITSDAFATVLPWFPYVLTVAVILFALSTALTYGYYGEKAWSHLFGRSKPSLTLFRVLYTVCAAGGSLLTLTALFSLADAVLFILAVFNIIGLYLLFPVVRRELKSFLDYAQRRDNGEPEPEEEKKDLLKV
ncbi:alanine:cation symporter family protein [Streptomyces sp. TRM66268-LWL]|uniref:Alanine:cation symporter family protein n=1 Tax=Streptomyces polyasparticus TaxID=2767826 RepID=A0ABR7SVF9_9ACTN|nr:alanine/glycine:cation symporter family protein [Streptomyces polyasparticus]MBC9718253.1 alanine:cation symporter family protein [Streptomyces polyasparticus]